MKYTIFCYLLNRAFFLLTENPQAHSVTTFRRVSKNKYFRVRVTAMSKSPSSYRVTVGEPNHAETEHIRRNLIAYRIEWKRNHPDFKGVPPLPQWMMPPFIAKWPAPRKKASSK